MADKPKKKAKSKIRRSSAKGNTKHPSGDHQAQLFHVEHPPANDEARTVQAEIVGNPKMGRPTQYDESFPDALVTHMAKGLSFESFGAALPPNKDGTMRRGVTKSALYDWEKAHADFSDAKKRGELACQIFWERLGIMGVSGKYKGFNAVAYIFNMKNRFKWKDRHDVNVKGSGNNSGLNSPVQVLIPSNGREAPKPEEVKKPEEENDN